MKLMKIVGLKNLLYSSYIIIRSVHNSIALFILKTELSNKDVTPTTIIYIMLKTLNIQRCIYSIHTCMLNFLHFYVQWLKCNFPRNCTLTDQSVSYYTFLHRYGCKKCNSTLIGQKFVVVQRRTITHPGTCNFGD